MIDRFHVRLGSLVDEGDLLTTMSDNSKMWVYFNVAEAEYLDYKAHMAKDIPLNVKLLMANNQLFEYPGRVETIEADFDNETGNIPFRATFLNPKWLLRHGETGNILVEAPFKQALIIPQKATFEIMDKRYVYVVDKDNIVQLRQLTVAAEMPDLYVIRGGLTKNDKILLEGMRKVKEHDKITYEYQEPRSVIAHLRLPTE
jgi:membrane fusion protein (multidrug efflux system)